MDKKNNSSVDKKQSDSVDKKNDNKKMSTGFGDSQKKSQSPDKKLSESLDQKSEKKPSTTNKDNETIKESMDKTASNPNQSKADDPFENDNYDDAFDDAVNSKTVKAMDET